MDNSINRLQDVFFYGLYMDEDILKSKGVEIRNQRVGIVNGYKLRVGNMATLLRDANSKAYGLVYSLTHEEIYKLYEGSGLSDYVAEALLVEMEDNITISALCCNLLNEPLKDEKNDSYNEKLLRCMTKYKLPITRDI